MKQTDKTFNNKPIAYTVEKDGYTIYLDSKPWIEQKEPYGKPMSSDKSYEENCLLHIDSLVQAEKSADTLEERIARLEEKVGELTYIEKALGEGVIEIIKKEEMASGDYTNPIKYVEGMSVEKDKWYYLDDKDLPREAVKSGTPKNFDDEEYLV